MGTDIHTYIEKRNKSTNKWHYFPLYVKQDDHETNSSYTIVDPIPWRSYPLFAILAEVRGSFLNAPIAPPRGIPKDISPEVQEIYTQDEDYIHTPSYFTLQELTEYYYKHLNPVSPTPTSQYLITNVDGEPIPFNGMNAYITPLPSDYEEEEFQCGLNRLRKIIDYMDFILNTDLDLNSDDVRIIFWFDS